MVLRPKFLRKQLLIKERVISLNTQKTEANPAHELIVVWRFLHASLLCELWNDVQNDTHIVKCTYRSPTDESTDIEPLTAEWVENHCSISQYCLQMAKCYDRSCCKEPRCDLKTIIQGKFLPGHLLTKRSKQSGMQLANIGEEPLKGKRVYTNIMETMALSNLRPKGYEETELSYDLYYIVHQYRRRLQSRVRTGINAYFLGWRNFSPRSNWQRTASKF